MQQPHVAYIVYVYLRLQYDNEGPAVHFDGENRGGEKELADHGLPLEELLGWGVSAGLRSGTYLRINYLKLPWAGSRHVGDPDQGEKRSAKEHLDYTARAVVYGVQRIRARCDTSTAGY